MTREGPALVQPEPPSIAAATLTRWFPGPASGATPTWSGSRCPFVRRAGPPHGGSSLQARSARDSRFLRPSDLLDPTSPDDFCNLSRPADTPANPDPRLQFSRHSCECRPPQDGRTPRTAGGGRMPANRGGRALQPTPIHRITRAPFVVVLRFREPGAVLAASLDDLGLACLTVARTTM